MKQIILLLFALILTLSGCVNPYSQFYRDYTEGRGVVGNPIFLPSGKEPVILQGIDPSSDAKEMVVNGYACIGESSFNAGEASSSDAKSHAIDVGADKVLLYSKYSHTESGTMPMTTPDNKTSTTYSTATAYGSGGGYANAYGTSTTNTFGTKTTYVPYSIRRYDYLATFWTMTKPPALGAILEELTPEQKRQIQSNKGACVIAVRKSSPAFENDILEGDIIRQINGTDVIDVRNCVKTINEHRGESVTITLMRNGSSIQKTVKLNDLKADANLKNIEIAGQVNDSKADGDSKNVEIVGQWIGVTPENERIEYVFTRDGKVTWIVEKERAIHAKYETEPSGTIIKIDMFDFDIPQLAGFRFLGIAEITETKMKIIGVPVKGGKSPDGTPAERPKNIGKDAIICAKLKQSQPK